MTTDQIIQKVKKLLLYTDAGRATEAEAAVAMAKVQELLAEHNLSLGQVEQAELEQRGMGLTHEEDIAAAKRSDEKHTRGAMYEYQQKLWSTIASVNFCWYFAVPVYKYVQDKHGKKQHRKVNTHHRLVGREVNVIAAKLLGDYLEEAINRNCPWQGRECLSKSAISWKEGCASRLQARLHDRFSEMQEESTKAAADTKALTLANVKDAEWEANYGFLYGVDALKKYKERQAERRAKAAQEIVNAPAEKPETNAQRKKREAKAARDQERYQRRQDKYWERRDMNAWYMGREKGDEISLDGQLSRSNNKSLPEA